MVVASVALGIALAGVAYATIPDSGGVIDGCYLKVIGSLRVIDPSLGQHCSALERPIQWNQTGPLGPTGAAGAQGPAGPTGPAGPAGPGVSVYDTGASPLVTLNDQYDAVATLTLPDVAGPYAITAQATVGGPAGDPARCYLVAGEDANSGYIFAKITATAPQAMSLSGEGVVQPGPNQGPLENVISLHCNTDLNDAVTMDQAAILAIG